jgi:hypothetical protein
MSEALIRNALNDEAPPEALPQTLDLDIDVMFHAQRVTRLHLEEPTGGQYEKAVQELASGPNAYTLERFKISLIAAVAKVDRSVVQGMKKSQIEDAYGFLSRLLAAGQPTGET